MKFSRLSGAALAVAALVAAMAASAAYGITTASGISGQPDFKSCISNSGSDGCADVHGMTNPSGMDLADDESRVFVASPGDNGVVVLQRDRTTGTLEQLRLDKGGCINEGATDGCEQGHGLNGASDVVALGANAYIAATGSNSVVTLTKDSQSGAWKQLLNAGSNQQYCLSTPAGDGCASATALTGATAITGVGSYVYVGGPGTIAEFRRSTDNKGALKQLSGDDACLGTGCANGSISGTVVDMTVSRDGKNVYAVDGNSLLVFSRNKATGALTQLATPSLSNVTGPKGVSVDQQGTPTSVYITGSNNAVGVFARNKNDGTLTQLIGQDGCVSAGGGSCTSGPRLANIGSLQKLVVYKTNRYVYVAGSNGVAAFARTKSGVHGGALTPLADPGGCVIEGAATAQCLGASGIGGLTDIFSTGGGKHIYVSGTGFDSVVTFHQH